MELAWYERSTKALISEQEAIALQAQDPEAVLYLPDALLAPEFPHQPTGERDSRDDWPTERCLKVGRQVVSMLAELGDSPPPVTREIFRRLSILRLSASIKIIRNPERFGSFTAFKDAIGAPVERDRVRFRDRYIGLQERSYISRAHRLARALGRKPHKPDYVAAARRGDMPGYSSILGMFGGVDELNDRIGFPNYKTWDNDRFIDFGVEFVRINGIDMFVPMAFDMLGQQGNGPWSRSVTTRFPGKWSEYKTRVIADYEELTDQEKSDEVVRQSRLQRYRSLVEAGELLLPAGKITDDRLLEIGSRYMLLGHCAPTMDQSTRAYHAVRRRDLLKVIPTSKHCVHSDIELEARELNVIDDIWPTQKRPLDIKLNPHDLKRARAIRRQTDRSRRALKSAA